MPLLGQDFFGSLKQRVAILGPGLIGGSLALALSRDCSPYQVSVWARSGSSAAAAAARLPACLVSTDPEAVLGNASVAVFCMNPEAITHCAGLFAGFIAADAAVTDAGSVKAGISASLKKLFGGRFVGAHPMAGSEESGIGAARADLFESALCILTPDDAAHPQAAARIEALWTSAGCRLHHMTPAAHDAAMARISHLPHAVASALVQAALAGDPGRNQLAGGGYRDSTRIAAGPPGLWTEIFLANQSELSTALADVQERLETLRGAIETGDRQAVLDFLTLSQSLRSTTRS